jgi:2-polyprenyl-3-methyl-5-hydroxy-6-metoxy-1,4-benzoquinol methylase
MSWRDKRLAICVTANQDKIDTNFTWSLLNMYKPKSFCILHEGQHIKSNSLNRLVDRGMDFGADKFLFLDVDMEFPSNTIAQLLTHDLDIVSGLYHIKVWPYSPVAGLVAKNKHRVNMKGKHWKEEYASLPENQLVEVGWAGIGCLMVDKKVFETIPMPCFRDKWDNKRGQRSKGHDILFCEIARKHGFKVYVDTSIDCTHRHSIAINKLYVEAYHESGMEDIMRKKLQDWSSEPSWWNEKWMEVAIKRREQIHLPEVDYIVDNVPEGVNVGDIGCGSGYALHRLKQERDCKGHGYDFSKMAIDVLETRGLTGEVCDVRTFNPNGASYHTVICSHLIEHVDDEYEERLVKTIAKMAKEQAFISVPYEDKLWIEHKRLYTERKLKKLLKPHFAEVKVMTLGDGILAHCTKEPAQADEASAY